MTEHVFPRDAACADADPETFYPTATEGTPAYTVAAQAALSWCDVCPVRAACLNDALDRGDVWAIVGGTTPAERERYARARAQCERVAVAGR